MTHEQGGIMLRRVLIIATALAVAAGATAAFAAGSFNTYSATQTFSPAAAGSVKKPSPMAITENWVAHGTSGHTAAPLIKIVSKIYGEKIDSKDFPKCTSTMINNNGNKPGNKGWNKICPKGSLIGQGPVTSDFVNPNPPYNVVGQCNPYLYIYNGGNNTQVFFFTEYPYAPATKYNCLKGHVVTGAAPAYNGHVSYSGKTYVLTIPLPPTVSNNAGGTGLFASLLTLHVTYAKDVLKGHAYGASIGCSSNKRPYEFDFTAQNYNGLSPHTQTVVVKHTAAC
jgi:hypothetical protein